MAFDPTGNNPFDLLDEWMKEAEKTEINDPNAVALATVSDDGWPSVRMVLMKGRDEQSIHFYTNYTSRKAAELDSLGRAAMSFHWKSLRRQLRLVGRIERLAHDISDAYYNSRPYGSRIGAWASQQSQPLASRDELSGRVKALEAEYPEAPPRPPFWGGYRLIPHEIEFWQDGESRLHDRFRFTKPVNDLSGSWQVQRLYP
ncbi:MAG: pyridoxamine 5'-phosphate oxidase [Alphaproteobacteria bacterium]|nr:pyridoxamine 5'-phosphate oxidase [Alphaproteobacteria bacterium]